MAANGAARSNAPADFQRVLAALNSMQANVDRNQKEQAHEFLQSFQKSQEAWTSSLGFLQSNDSGNVEAKLFAATTLKQKITYDLHQLPRESLPQLRDALITLLSNAASTAKPIRTQLCVSMAHLAIQMLEWRDPVSDIVSTLGTDETSISCMLEFLRVLPEEVTEGRKINLSEDELAQRSGELLDDNVQNIQRILTQYAQHSQSAAKDPHMLECLNAWLREMQLDEIARSPLMSVIANGLDNEQTFDAAVECICTIFRETRDVDECKETIDKVFPVVIAQRARIAKVAEEEDAETLKGLTRIFAEAGEAWAVLIARMPDQFRPLVESVLECCARDRERDAIGLTFPFWYELKQYLVLGKYIESRAKLADIYSNLVDVMFAQLEFPKPESEDETDLFDGDREQEEKFREFRHQMGDVLKDCCEVLGVTECLRKTTERIQTWASVHGTSFPNGTVPNWQPLEAAVFSLRAMGRMVNAEESIMLPQILPLIVSIPDHQRIRFQVVMTIGRYTEWTAQHPEFLQDQLKFIIDAFQHSSKDVVQAAALSFKFLCKDCAFHLKDYIGQLHDFYESVIDNLGIGSQEEITDGIAAVIARQPIDQIHPSFKLCCDPVIERLKMMAERADDNEKRLALADRIQLVTIFVEAITPYVEPNHSHPAVQYCQEIFPVLSRIAEIFASHIPILERVCRCWRHMVLSYRSAIAPILPQLADKLAAGFSSSRQGCFLWATDSIVQEFSEGAQYVNSGTTEAIFNFYEQQATTFLRALNDLKPEELPDVIEDFFRLSSDIVIYYPEKAICSPLMVEILRSASAGLTLLSQEPLLSTLHFLRDLLMFGNEIWPTANFGDDAKTKSTPPGIRNSIKQLFTSEGASLTERVMTGMMYTFPKDCVADASGVLLGMLQILPQETNVWIRDTILKLPQGSMTPQESQRLMAKIDQRIQAGEIRQVRTVLQDFTSSYRRRNVAPREGLGQLEATRFRFSG